MFFDMLKNPVEKLAKFRTLILPVCIILIMLAGSFVYLFTDNTEAYSQFYASGNQASDFRIFYLPNDTFGENPQPHNLHYLMSFTDYIEIDSLFSANFSQEVDVIYNYQAIMRLVIRQLGASPQNRPVLEDIWVLSQAGGETTASRLFFTTENDGGPGGIYRVFPREHIMRYSNFLQDHTNQLSSGEIAAQGFRGFSADLFVDFTYTINVAELGLTETVTHGYQIPLTTEVFSIVATGSPNFAWESELTPQRTGIALPLVIAYVSVFALCIFKAFQAIKQFSADPDEYRQRANDILIKYNQDIVIYDKPIDFARYDPMAVREFSELLKLSINLNKHIMCYKCRAFIEFVVIIDEFACYYVINFERNGSEQSGTGTLQSIPHKKPSFKVSNLSSRNSLSKDKREEEVN